MPVNLWQTWLQEQTQPSIPSKSIVLLGDVQSGKKSLLKCSFPQLISLAQEESQMLAMDYSVTPVVDEDEVVGNLGVFSFSKHFSFLLRENWMSEIDAFGIVLDWTRPWEFIDTLDFWLKELEQVADALDESKRDALRGMFPADASEGTLTRNIGLPLFIICHKSDAIHSLEKEGALTEDRVDFIQQVLRTISLQYGASLFYTNTFRKETAERLREHLLFTLFHMRPNTAQIPLSELVSEQIPFKPQVVEKDTVFVPSGWDSWGKISILKPFDCKQFQVGMLPAKADFGVVHELFNQAIKAKEGQSSNELEVIKAEEEQAFLEKQLSSLPETARVITPLQRSPSKELSATGTSPAPGSDSSQQVLQSFFQSLLTKKGSGSTKRGAEEALNKLKSNK